MRAVRIPVVGPIVVEDVVVDLPYLNAAVGGYIEAVAVREVLVADQAGRGARAPAAFTVYLNEEGKLDGLPLNLRATHLALASLGGDVIVGDAVVLGPPDAVGDDTPAPDELLDVLRQWDMIDA